ncbi:MAG: flagellar assembly peptidoglycan hydrolase FlgJ [Natronospirillum sp.]
MSLPTSAFSNPNMNMQDAFIYNDVQGLQNIKRQAGKDYDAALRAVSQQFEAMFMQMVMKSMRDATNTLNEDSFLNTQYTEQFQQMHDEQLVQNMSQSGGMGLSEVLFQQLSRKPESPTGNNVPDLLPLNSTGRPILPPSYRYQNRSDNDEQTTAGPGTTSPATKRPEFSSPEAFVQAIWPYAEAAAETMDADPRYLVAQAALETGWGQHVIGRQGGGSTHNLFNIKADQRWSGDSARVDTREYLQGRPVTVAADFRAYDDFAQSFADYQDFLSRHPRYEQALQVAPDGPAYARALQSAGYATDPAYAEKIDRIANSPYVMQGLAAVEE